MHGWRALVVLLGGCYHPSFATDVPCSADLQCPGDQVCDTAKTPPLCVSQLGSGGPDGGEDGQTVTADAPAFCASCDGTTPVCVNGTSCRACFSDDDCTSHVCEESTGQCYPTAQTLFVKTTGNDANPCTHDLPCANVSRAIQLVDSNHPIIRIYDGSYNDAIQTSQSFILSGENNPNAKASIAFKQLGHDHVLEINGGTAVVEGVALIGGQTETVRVTGSTTNVALHDVEISGSPLGSIASVAASLAIEGLYLHDNMGGSEAGLTMTSGTLVMKRSLMYTVFGSCVKVGNTKFDIENSYFAGCTGDALTVTGNATATMIYNFNTAAYNTAGVNSTPLMTVTNSILAYNTDGATPNELAGLAQASYSLLTDDAPPFGNNVVGDPKFVDNVSDLHIQTTSPAKDHGDPNSTPTVDWDGDARPRGNGYDIGADEI